MTGAEKNLFAGAENVTFNGRIWSQGTWTRFNDDAHQFAGIGPMAADQNIYGRIYVGGAGRGVLYSY